MEDVFVVAIVFGSLLGMLKLWLNYRRDRNQVSASSRAPEPSLTTSELKALLTDAIEEAFDRRIDLLENRLAANDRARLAPASSSGPDDVELEHPAPPLVARDRDSTQ